MRPLLRRSRAICAGATGPSPNHSKLPRTHTVAFENWSQRNTDVLRLKRLLMGGGLSALALAGEAGMVPAVFTCGVAGPGLGGVLGRAARECPKIASLIREKMLMGTPDRRCEAGR